MITFNSDWDEILAPLFQTEYYKQLRIFLSNEYKTKTVYPNMYNIFNCFKATSFSDVKVVILGQDPYHEVGQAHGLSFSVPDGIKFPPSLKNIFKELKSDLNIDMPLSGDLTKWAKQGVLLLNTVLTVEEGKPNSHKDSGWRKFTDDVISLLSKREKPIVFILWGNNAKEKKALIDTSKHYIIESAHPSPFSCNYGFYGSKPFSKTNEFLTKNNQKPIDWDLTK